MLKLFFACICIGYTVSINAQESINGRILDEHEQGFEAAVVMLVSLPENVLIETAVTDSTGRFHLPVHKGEFLLCIRSLGYKEKTKNITISGPNTIPDIYLEPDEIFLQDVVVTARKSRPIASFSNGKVHINVAQSYLTDIGSALDVLKHSPGVSVNNKGDISLASLGGTAIYVNGRASYLSVPKELVLNFINSLVDNPKQVILSGKKGNSVFPPYTIVSMQSPSQIKRYSPNLFKYDQIDLRMKRHLTPSTITLMFNNICVTNCIYCYQDKSHVAKCTIPLERIKELIREAYKLNVNTFDVIGGEFFLYKYWRDVLAELRRYGYNPYLSTKMPLQENDVQFLAKLKVRDIQISLDSCIEEHLIESINVRKGYVAEMLKSLMLLEKYGILVKVHSVLTKYTKDIADMRSIYNVLKNLKNIEDWHVVKGEETLYPRTDYSNIEIDSLSYNNIVNYLKDLSDSSGMSIHYPKLEQIQIVNNTIDKLKQAESHFFNRAFCSGLFSSLYILPDGQVTMCEQLYWNKRFIIGNVKSNSILEIWNSKEAKSLYEIKQEDFPEDSLCHSCGKFKECRTFRQVCYRDIIRKYGSQKWYYPDVKCPYNNQK